MTKTYLMIKIDLRLKVSFFVKLMCTVVFVPSCDNMTWYLLCSKTQAFCFMCFEHLTQVHYKDKCAQVLKNYLKVSVYVNIHFFKREKKDLYKNKVAISSHAS